MKRTGYMSCMGILLVAALISCNGVIQCVDFEDTNPGDRFHVGEQLQTSGTTFAVEPFQWGNGTWTSDGFVKIDQRNYALGSGYDVDTNNASLSPAFSSPVEWIGLRFGELGGNNNIRVNSVFANVQDLNELEGTALGGAHIFVDSVESGNNRFGVMLVLGPIDDFAIGGQELWLDDFCYLTTSTEPEPVTWARSYGGPERDTGWSILATMDGGYLVAGASLSFDITNGLWLLKLNQQGDVLWQKMYEGCRWLDEYARIQETADGGFVVSHQGPGGTHVLRLTSTGTVTWSRAYDLDTYIWAKSMALAADGSIFLAGSTSPPNPADFWADACVMRLNASGDVTWSKRFGTPGGAEFFSGVAATSDGGCVAAGFGPNGYAWIVKVDASGNSQWQREYAAGTVRPYTLSILQTTDGGYLATGRYEQSGSSNSNAWLLRLDSSGNTLWQRRYGDSLYEIATSALEKSDGGFVVTGAVYETGQSIDFWLFGTDANGNVLWQQRYGGTEPEYSREVVLADDGGFAFAGRTSSFGAGDMDVWVVKVAGDGSIADPCPWSASTGAPVTDTNAPSTTTNIAPVDLTPTVTPRTVAPVSTEATGTDQCPAPSAGG